MVLNYGRRLPFDCFYADDFGAGWGFGLGFGGLDRRCANQSHGAAVEFLAGVFGGAFEANLVAVEVGQEAFRAGVHPVDEGQAAVVVALDILQPATKFELFVADGVEGGFDTVKPQQAPIGHGDLADQEFRTGGGGLVLGAVVFEHGLEFGWIFAGHDDGFGAQAVFEAVETDGGAAFGRGRTRAVLRVLAVRFDFSVSQHDTPLVECYLDYGIPCGSIVAVGSAQIDAQGGGRSTL